MPGANRVQYSINQFSGIEYWIQSSEDEEKTEGSDYEELLKFSIILIKNTEYYLDTYHYI